MGGQLAKHVKSALVVGGGVGGAAVAIRLAERGVVVDLVDIQENWGTTGTGVTLSVLTARALCDLGFADGLMDHGHMHDTITFHDVNGVVQHVKTSPRLFSPDVPAEGGVLRPVLHNLLAARLEVLGVSVCTATTVASFSEAGDKIHATFSDGRQASYDLMIGADGIQSKIRQTIRPDVPKPRYTGQVCWRAQFELPAHWQGGMFFYGPHKVGFTPCGKNQMYMFLLENVPEKPWYEGAELLPHLKELLAPFGGELGAIRDAMDETTPVMARPLETVLVDDPWYLGRVVIIGDAAHSTTPHLASGAGMAVEDAIVLVDELDRAESVEAAMRAFMRRRLGRGQLVVGNSIRLGEMEQRGEAAEAQRALMLESIEAISQPY